MFKKMQLSNNFVKPDEQLQACLLFAVARNCRRSQQKMRMKYSRLCAYFQAITRMKKKKRQPKMLVCRLVSE
jgi:hypothetical protein